MAKYKYGEMLTVQHTAGSAISADDVIVLGGVDAKKCTVGVAMEDIASGAVGSVAVTGVFEFAKVTGAVILSGQAVNWDSSETAVEDNAHTTAAGDVGEFGKAMQEAGSGVLLIEVEIGEPGTYDAA